MQTPASKTKLLNPIAENIEIAVNALKSGDVIGLPTETVYGLAGNALSDEAVAKIFLFKSRPSFDPLIVHVPETLKSCEKLHDLNLISISTMTALQIESSNRLMESFWPGPLTIIFPKHPRISDLVTSSLETVGLRSPAHPVAQEVLKRSGLPLAAPSANQFGRISPTKAEHVLAELGAHLNYCLEGGECSVGLESTICSVDSEGSVNILRPGGVSIEALQKALGARFHGLHSELGLPSIAARSPIAPGLLESHYAPRKPMYRWEGNISEIDFTKLKNTLSVLTPFILSADIRNKFLNVFSEVQFYHLAENENDSVQGAKTLFSQLRDLDKSDSEMILCTIPDFRSGLWPAIRDRLTRASKKLS